MTQVQTLADKEIVLGVTGSIAAVETVKLIHALRKKGAVVQPVMSHAATGIIHPDALTYAAGRTAITRISGMVEHVMYCGDGGSADLLLIAPGTANTIGKIASGIDDTTVTTFATTALGSNVPVLIVPAMHHSMYRHPAVIENLQRLKRWGIGVVDPRIEEEKAKIASIEEIVLSCERELLGKPLDGKKILITSGPCREKVDDIRVLTTRSSGQMGRELALEGFRLGAEVTVVHSGLFPCVTNLPAVSAQEMREQVLRHIWENGADIYMSAAAISDYAPVPFNGKIESGRKVSIELLPLSKVIGEVVKIPVPIIIAFKLGRDTSAAAEAMLNNGVSFVVTNPPETMDAGSGEFILVSKRGRTPFTGTKEECAALLFKMIVGQNR
ncbi:MAG: bifunctional phosphopantothenoylcysteine decarboxylase/phosphopantothenate--cysteine ligase CoaBC [Methanoregula sp.]|nr:MAG: bifunctional phosphopantothenoylcysteine decarboxylase/phosphopantothenate--cysteine ligase CoaBC [Methanoregula sp.]